MSRRILIQKAARIEGNANMVIEVAEGRIKTARFMVQDFRGFEKFMQGKQIELAPHLISRICGLCSVSHQVAGFQAIEKALHLEVPGSVQRLRDIALLGETISSHSLSYFFLTMPDMLGGAKGIFDLMKLHPETARDAFLLKKLGSRIVEIICRRTVHPISLSVGQILIPPSQGDLDEIRKIATNVKELSLKLIRRFEGLEIKNRNIAFPENHRINFLTMEEKSGQQFLRVFDRTGKTIEEFLPKQFDDNIAELRVDWSFAKFPYLKNLGFPEGILVVGPLARLFHDDSVLTDPDLKGLKLTEILRDPMARHLDDIDICRLLEIFSISKRILRYLENVDLSMLKGVAPDLQVSARGIGIVEAPRGILVHSYVINRGSVENLRLLVATQFNNAYINLMLKDLGDRHIDGDKLSKAGEDLLARCVRMFDPCLTCATH